MKIFFYISITCWILSLILHLLSIADIDLLDKTALILTLIILMFIVLSPAMYIAKYKDFGRIIKNVPTWLIVISIACLIYCMINSIWLIETHTGTTAIKDGQYILESHGTFIKTLTEKEYHHYNSMDFRLMSGMWLLGYGFSLTLFYSFKKIVSTDNIDKK
jgi:hypothetical protein